MANVDSFKLFANLYHNMQANIVTYQRNKRTQAHLLKYHVRETNYGNGNVSLKRFMNPGQISV